MSPSAPPPDQNSEMNTDKQFRTGSDIPFYICFGLISAFYLVMILAMLFAESTYTTPGKFFEFLQDEDIQYSMKLSFFSCAVTTFLSLCVAVPIGYLMSRHYFWGKSVVDAILDIPIVLPPLVIGLCLLILFNSSVAGDIESSLHGVENFISHNLIPVCCLIFLLVLGIFLSFLLRDRVSHRSMKVGIPVLITVVGMLIFMRAYLFPTLPQWVPDLSLPGLSEPSVTFRDQHPLARSQHVYSASYTFLGKGDQLIDSIRAEWKGTPLLDDNIQLIPQPGRNGMVSGEQILVTTFPAGIDSWFPDGGELELRLVPEVPTAKLTQLQAEMTTMHNIQEPLQKKYRLLRDQFNVRDEFSAMWDQLKKAKKTWESDLLSQSLSKIERHFSEIEQGMQAAQREMKSLQTAQSLRNIERKLKQLDKELLKLEEGKAKQEQTKKRDKLRSMQQTIVQIIDLKSKIDLNEDQIRKILRQRDQLQNQWRTESIRWLIVLNIKRPKLLSRADIFPTIVFPVTYAIPSVILAQFMVACAFAVRTMRVTFDQIHPRYEQVALTLGCNQGQAFWRVVFPQAWRGVMAAATLAWARSLGEFGPILIFSGTIKQKTEVLPSSVFLQFTTGNLSGAVSASLIIIFAAFIVLIVARVLGLRKMSI